MDTWNRKRTKEMNRRDKEICRLVLEEEMNMAEVGRMFKLTRERIRQIVTNKPHEASRTATDETG